MTKEEIRRLLLAISLQAEGDFRKITSIIHGHVFPSEDEINAVESKINCKYVTYIDEEYPRPLKNCKYPPLVLYYYGDLSLANNEEMAIAVIGSRETSEYGEYVTRKFVKDLCQDYVIVSGLAKGIDAIGHQEAIENKAKTIAVLGSGIDYCYPKENYALYKEIKEKGLVISEYPNMVPPLGVHFPMRNRLIAGLAKGILITEAKSKSGSFITVSWGQIMNKDIMCIPYPIEKESGCNQLIKEGAFMVESSEEVRYIMEGVEELKNH